MAFPRPGSGRVSTTKSRERESLREREGEGGREGEQTMETRDIQIESWPERVGEREDGWGSGGERLRKKQREGGRVRER